MNTILKSTLNTQASFRFPKTARLRKKGEFRRLFLNGKKFSGELLSIHYFLDGKDTQLGISVSKKLGKSNLRNRFKRVIREAYRKVRSSLPPGLKLHVAPRKSLAEISPTSYEAQLELVRFQEEIFNDRGTPPDSQSTSTQSC